MANIPTGAVLDAAGRVRNSLGQVIEFTEGYWQVVKNGDRSGWWRFHDHYDRDGYCDNPGRGY